MLPLVLSDPSSTVVPPENSRDGSGMELEEEDSGIDEVEKVMEEADGWYLKAASPLIPGSLILWYKFGIEFGSGYSVILVSIPKLNENRIPF